MSRSARRIPHAIELFEDRAIVASSSDEIHAFLSFLPRMPRYVAIRTYLLYRHGDLIEYFTKRATRMGGLTVVNADVGGFRYSRTCGRKHIRTVDGLFVIVPSSQRHMHRLISVCYSGFWNDGIRYLIRHSYPHVKPVFFKQGEMQDAIRSLQDALGARYRFIAADYSVRERGPGVAITQRPTKYDSGRWWREELEALDAFDYARQMSQWFTSFAFDVEHFQTRSERYKSVASCKIYKYGYLGYDALHGEFTGALLPLLEERTISRMTLFENRGIRERRERGDMPSAPLEISYPIPVFEKPEELHKLQQTIRSFPNATKAVYHGNPYFHASVADVSDGSSFDLWVLSPSRMLIVPQAKSTAPALDRIVSHIFTDFREGEITEFQIGSGGEPLGD